MDHECIRTNLYLGLPARRDIVWIILPGSPGTAFSSCEGFNRYDWFFSTEPVDTPVALSRFDCGPAVTREEFIALVESGMARYPVIGEVPS